MAFNLLKTLHSRTDIIVTVLLLNDGRLAEELRTAGIDVTVVEENDHSVAQLIRHARDHVRRTSPDIIHSHRYKENVIAFAASIGSGRVQLVATQHGLPEGDLKKLTLRQRWKYQFNFLLLSRFFAKTVAVSTELMTQLVQRYGISSRKLAVIYNGVPRLKSTGSASKNSRFCIGSSGRLAPVKDYLLMVEVARVIAPQQDARFELAGDGPCRGEIQALVEKYGLEENFTLKGHVAEMDTFYHGLDLYINTSLHEGIPMTILEAMARGLPVIAPDVGGIGEVVESGVQGYLVQGRDAADFAAKCSELMQNNLKRAAMSKAAVAKVEKSFSAEAMAENYHRLYRELLLSQ